MKYKTTLITWSLITIIFLVTNYIGLSFANRIRFGALYDWNGQTGEWWRVITYGFLHNSLEHFLGNLIVGIIVMLYIENKTNSMVAFIVFFLGIVIGGVGLLVFNTQLRIMTTGSSGGVWALLASSGIVLLSKPKINLLEFLAVFNVTIVLFYDTYTATNVNYISHYTSYIGGMILMLLIILFNKEELNETNTSRSQALHL